MNEKWSLDVLYKGYDDPKFVEDEKQLDDLIKQFCNHANNLEGDPKKVIIETLDLDIKIDEKISDLFSFASLSRSTNTSDTKATSILGRLSAKMAALAEANTALTNYISQLDNLDEIIESDSFLKEHEFYLKNIKEEAKYTLSPEVEKVISLYEISGSSAWSNLQSYLTSTLPVEYEDKITNLSDIRNLAYDADGQVRKSAYEAELKAYERIKDSLAYSLNSIKMETIRRCQLKGYESPLDETLKKAHMKKETLDALMSAIEEYLPKFWEYLKAKAKLLRYDNGLPFYELFAPLKGNDKEYSIEDARNYLVNLFSDFDQEETDMIARAFDEQWIDFYPHDGKVGGAFCAGLPNAKQSRILTNYGGSLGDIITLAHELGHAFHNHCLNDNSLLNRDYSMPVAETASTFNEVVAMNAAIANEEDPIAKRALIENQLQDATQIICDIYSRYLFETAVFENRENEFMFADKLCELMLDAQKKAYGDGLDHNYLHPYMWCCKSHYYRSRLSFYNFPYAFGGLFARGLYAKYLKEGQEFVPLYKMLLKTTGTTTVEGAAQVAGIDLTDKNFWRSSLQILADEIDEFIALCE